MVIAASPALALQQVSRTYSEAGIRRVVLDGIDLEVGRGKLIAIQGRSGSGKSTLLNIVAGIDLPDEGSITIDGTRIDGMNERERTLFRRGHIGFVFQSFNLIPTLDVAENLMFPLELNGVSAAESRQRIDQILASFSLDGRANSYPDQLSGGEQQRVAIARAIIHRPQLVLADEPTGNLDRMTEAQILEILQRLPAEHGVTVITATHSPEIAEKADRVLQLSGGKLRDL
jgi:putative ABC transport system ATP-binding protein